MPGSKDGNKNVESELALAKAKLEESEQHLQEAMDNHESVKVLRTYTEQVRARRQRVTKLENRQAGR
jgi:hypothetical protein